MDSTGSRDLNGDEFEPRSEVSEAPPGAEWDARVASRDNHSYAPSLLGLPLPNARSKTLVKLGTERAMALERQRTDERLLFHTQLVYLRCDCGIE